MKTLLLSVATLAVGIVLGVGGTWAQYLLVGDYFEYTGNPRDFFIEEDLTPELAGSSDPATVTVGLPKLIVVDGEKYDFGSMEMNTSGRHTFVVKNIGHAPLQMTLTQTTCKCATTDIEEKKPFYIPPGGSKDITLEWKAVEYTPIFTQSAELQTGDPERPFLRLQVTGRLVMNLQVVPDDIVLSDVSTYATKSASLQIYAYKADDLKYVKHELQNPQTAEFFDVQTTPLEADDLRELREAKSGLKLTVAVKPGMPIGPINQMLLLYTNAQDEPLEIPIQGTIVGDISFRRQSNLSSELNLLTIGLVPTAQGKKLTLHVMVKGPYQEDVHLSVDPQNIDPNDVLKAEVGEPLVIGNGTARMFPLTIEIPPNSREINRMGTSKENLGRIIIETTHPKVKTIPLYVRFAVGQ